ncbi:MAG TPA: SNF2-related protein [Planctomycetaceae bacterium]|nr:SNF2-related protein [Planctomycetaceae bacterium]
MTLAQVFEGQFRGDIRFRGAAYLKAERVSITRVTPQNVFAVVHDGIDYQTQLVREGTELRMFCSCVQGDRPANFCKHLWATILAIDARGLIAGTVKPGHVPSFAVEEPAEPDFDDYWDGDPYRDVYSPPAGGRVRSPLAYQPQLTGWQSQLQKLSESLHIEATGAATAAREREIFYEIDATQSRERSMLVIQTSQRQRRSNGQWGKRKPLKLRPGQLDDIELDDDRRILAYLAGGAPERASWLAQQPETQATAHRYQVSFGLAEVLLPLLCATRRTILLGDDSEKVRPLEWDDGPPWELCVQVAPEDDADNWLLTGCLKRGTETLAIADATLLIPGGFVFVKHRVARFHDFGAFGWVELLRTEKSLEIPKEDGPELIDRLLDMPRLPELELPPELRLEEVITEPVPHLTLYTPRGIRWQHERLTGEVSFEYGGTLVRSSSPQGAIVQRELGRCLPRDRVREEAAWSSLEQFGARRLLNTFQGRHDAEIPAKMLGQVVRGLIGQGWQIHADGKQVHQPAPLSFEIKSGIDWFELHANVNFEGRSVPFPELLSALARGDSTVRLDDGSLGILPDEWLRRYGLLSGLGISEGDHVRFSRTQVGLLDALLAAQESVNFDAPFDDLRQRVREFSGIRTTAEPQGFVGALRPYQQAGVGWLQFLNEFRFGGCLADDMGLGKTIQFLASLQDRFHRGEIRRPSLVVVPKSLIFNWHQECTKFTPDLNVLEYTGLHRTGLRKKFAKAHVILTTYGTVRRDILHLKEIEFDYVVLDEAQAIKNPGSQVAKAARLLKADHRVALTGTPIENHLRDLWSIFEFLNPGMLGRASIFKLHTTEAGDEESRKLLSQALKPFILRRTKREVARELPEKFEQTIHCRMAKQQEQLYNDLRDHYRGSLLGMVKKQGLARSKIHVLEALLRLRQAACHPGLLDEKHADEPSAKLDVLGLHLSDLLEEGHKALVFSQFTSYLALVKRYLDEKNIVYEYLDGQTRNRKEHIERFQTDPACGVFLISLKAGGLGLNLTAADYVFLLDPWWNPAVEMQAIDRAHRIGQTRQVFAYRLICRDTVEEKIAELQNKKKELADAILQADNNLITDLTAEDLELLLS